MKHRFPFYLLACTTVFTSSVFVNTAFSQTALDVPSTAQPGQSERSIPEPSFQDTIDARIDVPTIQNDEIPDQADQITFTLNKINLEGVTAYDLSDLSPLWSDMIGKEISLTQVYGIAKDITRKYRRDGYIITQAVIPEQVIDKGEVTIQIIEGFLDRISQDGETQSPQALAYASNLKDSRPLTSQDLERWLLLVNDLPGTNARSIIGPSETTLGAADLTIIPNIDPYIFSASLDNYGSRYIGPLQLSLAAQINDLFNGGEALQLQYVTDPDDNERNYGYARYTDPINSLGTVMGIDATYSQTLPGFELEPFDVEGEYTKYGFDVSHPFIRSRTENLFASLRFDYLDLESDNIVDTFTTEDNIAALRLGVEYNIFDNIWTPSVNEVSLTLSQGLDVLGASSINDTNKTRVDGDPQFTKIEAQISRLQSLTNEISLYTALKGQLSNNPLLSTEEIGFGGRSYGRGYDASEIVGDDGFGATAEIRWRPDSRFIGMDDYELYGFYDFGQIWNQETEIEGLEDASIASTGLGIRMNFTDSVSGDLTFAYPLTKEVDAYDSADSKLLFSLSTRF